MLFNAVWTNSLSIYLHLEKEHCFESKDICIGFQNQRKFKLYGQFRIQSEELVQVPLKFLNTCHQSLLSGRV
jgi:hypothetical protein